MNAGWKWFSNYTDSLTKIRSSVFLVIGLMEPSHRKKVTQALLGTF